MYDYALVRRRACAIERQGAEGVESGLVPVILAFIHSEGALRSERQKGGTGGLDGVSVGDLGLASTEGSLARL